MASIRWEIAGADLSKRDTAPGRPGHEWPYWVRDRGSAPGAGAITA